MFTFLKNLFSPVRSSFVINEVDHLRKIVLLEDKQLNLLVEIPIGDKNLKEAQVIEPYVVLMTYEDGSKEKKRILK